MPTLRGTPIEAVVNSTTTVNVTKPTGVISGDYWLIALCLDVNNGPTITPPTGFVSLVTGGIAWNGNDRLYVYRKVCDGSEGASVAFGTVVNVFGHSASIAYSGVNNTTPEDVISTANADNTAAATKTQNSQTTVTAGATIVGFWTHRGDAGVTGSPGSGATQRISVDDASLFMVYVEELAQVAAGAIALQATFSSALQPWAYAQVALRPASSTFDNIPPGADSAAPAGWRDQAAGTTNLYQAIDETTASDADYIESPSSPASASEYKYAIAQWGVPNSKSSFSVPCRYGKDTAAGDRLDLTITLYRADGTTVLATKTVNDVGVGPIDDSLTVTDVNAATVPDSEFTDPSAANRLKVGFSVIKV